jgi:hypothetical protein
MGIWDCLHFCLAPVDRQTPSAAPTKKLYLTLTHRSRPHIWVSRVDVEFCHARSKIRVLLIGFLLRGPSSGIFNALCGERCFVEVGKRRTEEVGGYMKIKAHGLV